MSLSRKVFAKYYYGLATMYKTEVDDMSAELFYRAVSELTNEQFERAVNEYIKYAKWMPQPSEIRELALGSEAARAYKAWNLVEKVMNLAGSEDVQFSDPHITGAIELLGGWQKLGMMTDEEFKYAKMEFRKLYPHAYSKNILQGRISLENAMNGYNREELARVTYDNIKIYVNGKLKQTISLEGKSSAAIESKKEPYKAEIDITDMIDKIADDTDVSPKEEDK